MALISFGGLATGLDTKSIIEQLTAVQRSKLIDGPTANVTRLKTQQLALTTVNDALKDLRSAALTLKDPTNAAFNVRKATSSADTTVSVGSVNSSRAVNGDYNLTNITQLAQADRVIFNGVANTGTSQFGEGTFSITYKGSTVNIELTSSNNTLEGIKTAINDANAGVVASIVNDGDPSNPYRLILTSEDTGSDSAITHNLDSISTLTVDAVASASAANEPQNAAYQINGVDFTSQTNTVTDAISGVTFTLLNTDTTNTIKLNVKSDTTAVISKISSFINAYNTVHATIRTLVSQDPTTKRFGPMGQDIGLQNIDLELHRTVYKLFTRLTGSAYKSIAEVGITSDSSGNLQVDSSKLTAALEANPDSVRALFQGNSYEDGIATKVYSYLDNLTKSTGVIPERNKILDRRITDLGSLLEQREKQLEAYRARLEAKFNRLEVTINNLKARQSQVDSFGAVYSNSANQLL